MKYTLIILLMVVSCKPSSKVVYAPYSERQADSIVNMIDSLQVEMSKIEEK